MSFNLFKIILNQNKLTGHNYVDWKKNMDIILIAEGYKYVFNEEHLDLFAANAPKDDIEKFLNGLKTNSNN